MWRKKGKPNSYLSTHCSSLRRCPFFVPTITQYDPAALDQNQNVKFEHVFTIVGSSDLYACNACDRTFKRHATLKKHIRENHCSSDNDDIDDDEPITCPKCNHKCRSQSMLRKHICHLNEPAKPIKRENTCKSTSRRIVREPLSPLDITFECLICRNSFRDFRTLKQHVRVHSNSGDTHHRPPTKLATKSKMYKCHICTKRFCHQDSLRLHLYTHTGERPFECPFCAKHFSDPSNLNRHQRIHTGDRPYKCSTCNRRFMNSSNLKAHEMLHTNEKPFKCDICNGTFNRLDTLRNHIDRLHAKLQVTCQVCDRKFGWKSCLAKHMRRYHEPQTNSSSSSRQAKRFDAFA